MDKKSLEILDSCQPDLRRLMIAVDKIIPIRGTEGYRNPVRQEQLFLSRATEFETCKHNTLPESEAVDIKLEYGSIADVRRMYILAGVVKAVAHYEGIAILWGGDKTLDHKYNDLGHYELKGE